MLSLGSGSSQYASGARKNDIALGANVKDVRDSDDKIENTVTLRELYDQNVKLGSFFDDAHGYYNKDGGWADAAGAVKHLLEKVKSAGVQVLSGKEVSNLLKEKDKICGVKCKDGSEYLADIVVIASGAWTAAAFPELSLKDKAMATG